MINHIFHLCAQVRSVVKESLVLQNNKWKNRVWFCKIKRVCGKKILTFFSVIGGDHGSSVETGSIPRVSHDVGPST